jgi:DNA end-binding protein Ku
LAAVKPDGLFLILELMHFASEILSAEELNRGPSAALNEKELKMAQALVESMSVPWEPEKYRDEYRTAVMEMIEQKAKNKKIPAAPAVAPRSTNVVDLVKVLQESLNRSQSVRVKRTGNGARRTTSTLVKQKRRAAA